MSDDDKQQEEVDAIPEDDVKMTIWDHLGELRSRLFRAAIALVVTTGICWTFKERILNWLIKPFETLWYERHLPGRPELQTLGPADAFINYMQLSLMGGVIFAAPIVFYQVWGFISPGLYAREKRFVIPFVVFSTGLFLLGVFFAYYVAFPFTFGYFFTLNGEISEGGTLLINRPTFADYFDFASRMLLGFGFAFELPILITFMARAGIVTPKQLVKFSRWAVLLSFIVGAIITPGPEISSQLAVSSALCVLYALSVGLSFIVARKKKPADDGATGSEPAS